MDLERRLEPVLRSLRKKQGRETTYITVNVTDQEPQLFVDLNDEELLRVANVIERLCPKYRKRRLRRSIFRQIVLYRKTLRLSAEGLNYSEIARELGLRRSTPYFWLHGKSTPFTVFNIPEPNFDFGYLLGSGIGDGFVDSDSRQVLYSWLKDEDFANAIVESAKRLKIYGHKWFRRSWQVVVANVVISELVKVGKKDPLTLLPILRINKEVARGALAGFDAEGSPGSFNANGYKYDSPRGRCCKKEVIELMARLLEYLNIHHTIGEELTRDEFISPSTGKRYKPKFNKIYYLRISRCCVKRFSKLIGFRIRRKMDALMTLIRESRFKEIC